MPEAVVLDAEQRDRLHELERVVERNLASFLEAGRALLEIRDSGLYKQHYATFELYLVRRWGLSASRGNELMRATAVAENLLSGPAAPGGEAPLPEDLSEQSLRPLSKLSPELQCATWTLATRITQKPTHNVVSRLVRTIQTAIAQGYGKPAPKTKRVEPENTVFLRVIYKLSAMEAVSPQLIINAVTDPGRAQRLVAACRQIGHRCNVIAEELIEKFPGLS
jgi:hypothetical protein